MPFPAMIEDKNRRVSGRKTKAITYFLIFDGEKRVVGENSYNIANKGDIVRHPTAAQLSYINGQRYIAKGYAENTGFRLGIICTCCIVLFGGAYYRRFEF